MSTPPHPAPHASWQRVTDEPCAHGAAPFWHAQEERLYWLDRALPRVWRWHRPSGHSQHWDWPEAPHALAPCRRGGVLVATAHSLYRAQQWHDVPQRLVHMPPDPADTGAGHFTPGSCDPWGRFWLAALRTTAAGTHSHLHCLPPLTGPTPPLHTLPVQVGHSRGLCWSPDARLLYWADAAQTRIYSLALSPTKTLPPRLTPPLSHVSLQRWLPSQVQALTTDRAGRLWVALSGPGRIVCFDAHGQCLQEWAAPTSHPTGLCFGGPGWQTLYVTTARAGLTHSELAQHPDSGHVFACAVDTPGVPTHVYWD